MKLSMLMPVYNEAATLDTAVKRVLDARYPCEIELVVVDDGSVDATGQVLESLDDPRIVRGRHERNRGKGAAVKTAAQLATGDYLLIFDADLEYSPDDVAGLLQPVLRGDAAVVYGARTFGSSTAHSFWFVIGNKLTTFVANALFNSWITDLHTCLKLMPLELFRDLAPREDRFGLDTEITGLLLSRGIRPYEVPISYKARSHEEGKKITWRDGVEALRILVQIRIRQNRGGRGA
ncbi:MAG TPA: glycosyltransferase family 2 protein [Mycobacteriales bacterium]|nr:glycosyltransferase family 2 protein [Mycobacteriales bacterium]